MGAAVAGVLTTREFNLLVNRACEACAELGLTMPIVRSGGLGGGTGEIRVRFGDRLAAAVIDDLAEGIVVLNSVPGADRQRVRHQLVKAITT